METIKPSKISMVLSSCDKYEITWHPFSEQLKRYWPEFDMPIYLGTESKCFHFDGLDIRCPLSAGKKYTQWSERLLELLKHIDSEFVLFMLDDFWLYEPVDHNSFMKILGYMEQNANIGFCCLKNETGTPLGKKYSVESEYPELLECQKKKPFRITTQVGLWRKDYLIKIIRKHESAWYFETRATWRSRFCRERVFCVKSTIVTYPVGGVFWGGRMYSDYLRLYPEDVTAECVKERGTIKFGDLRTYPDIKHGISYYWSLFKSMLPKW